MINDTARLMNDVNVVTGILSPDVDEVKLMIRMEEILSNYDIKRKSESDIEDDFPEKIDLFLSAKRLEGASKHTLRGYRTDLEQFHDFTKKATVQVTTPDIRKFLGHKESWMVSTMYKKLSTLKSFYGWLVDEELLLRNPTTKIKPPNLPQRLPKGLSIKEVEMVREACETHRERAIMEVMYSTACRLSEIKEMKRSNMDSQNMSIRVIGKGDIERTVYFSDKAMYHLNKYLLSRQEPDEGPSDYLFIAEKRPFHNLADRAISRVVGKIEQRADISKHLTPHVFRHTFAMLAMEQGAALEDIQHILGHSNSSTTLIYAHVTESRKKEAHKRYHVQ